MSEMRGFDGVFYIGTAGSAAATEVTEIISVTPSIENGDAELTARSGNGFRLYGATLTDLSVEIQMIADEDDTEYVAIRTAAQTRGKISMKCLRAAGGSGYGGDVIVSGPDEPQEIDGYLIATFTMKPARSAANSMDWIAAGS